MRYFVVYDGDYIFGIYKARTGINEITKEEYEKIYDILQHAPEAPEGKGYRLRIDLTLEEYDLCS